jgi:tripartite-type tricarboxylate transporter receptor subunit TctC
VIRFVRTCRLAAFALAALCSPFADAQVYPHRPVRMVVPFPPGAPSDFLARALEQKLGEAWGQQIVVDNRPGAGGLIGGTAVAMATADGYTIALIAQPHLTAFLLAKAPPWDPFKDFTHICGVASMPNVAVTGPGLPVNSAGRADRAGQGRARLFQFRLGRRGQFFASRRLNGNKDDRRSNRRARLVG